MPSLLTTPQPTDQIPQYEALHRREKMKKERRTDDILSKKLRNLFE